MSRTAEIVLFTILGVTVLFITMLIFLTLVLEARRNKAYERRTAPTREVESHAPQSLHREQFPTGRPIHSDILLVPQQSTRVVTKASVSQNPYDSRYTYTCDCPDTWMGDGGSCPHS